MRAAIYARKSNDDNDRNPENKSVTRQVDHARQFITKMGWVLSEQHVYVDDGISGAKFGKDRPELSRMLAELKQFDAVVTMEQSRLGREIAGVTAVLKTLTLA